LPTLGLSHQQLLDELRTREVKIGVASSVLAAQWAAAEIFPQQRNRTLIVQPEQASLRRQLASEQRLSFGECALMSPSPDPSRQ
jgi:hypothetical protein